MSPVIARPLTLEGDVESFYVHERYVLTFSKTSADVWRAGSELGHLNHVTGFSEPVPSPPFERFPIVDLERNLVIVPDHGPQNGPPLLWVFSLADGMLIHKLELYGALAQTRLQYADGKVLVAVEENDGRAPPNGRTTILLCDVAGDGGLLGGVHLPARLKAREEKRLNTVGGVLAPVQLRPNGDVIATSSEAWHTEMEVLRWRGADVLDFPEPDASFELRLSLEGGDRIHPTCTAPLDENSFIMAVAEAVSDVLQVGEGCQTAIHAVDAEAMTIRWSAECVGGRVSSVHYVAAVDAIVAFGEHDYGESDGDDPFAYVVVLDPAMGTRRRMETIKHPVQGTPLRYCGLGKKADGFAIIIVFRDGLTYAVDLRQFLEHGFPEDGTLTPASTSLEKGWEVEEVGVAGQTVILSVCDSTMNGSLHIRYFELNQ
ncbi:hypothetical protein DAEQUDRAFT_730123 [Daedalea quercina L-15889]|uniref:NudC domain-containing protein 1 n=1 Tax=Daedalea quercina L-15889 TaxID=1314783 RepID=A0A165N5X5_9APHY|nr:hypothetical protein DAEQUDRAFT_730123 [Daedalea quercina L-15889]